MFTSTQVTQMLFHYYDHNRDGVLQTKPGSQYEGERLVRTSQPYSYTHDQLNLSWVSHARLMKVADRNQDLNVSFEEVQALLSGFDVNQDQQLDEREIHLFQQVYPEERGLIEQQFIARATGSAGGAMPWAWGNSVGRGVLAAR